MKYELTSEETKKVIRFLREAQEILGDADTWRAVELAAEIQEEECP